MHTRANSTLWNSFSKEILRHKRRANKMSDMVELLKKYQIWLKRVFVACFDVLSICFSAFFALLLRFDLSWSGIEARYLDAAWDYLPFNIVITLIIFWIDRDAKYFIGMCIIVGCPVYCRSSAAGNRSGLSVAAGLLFSLLRGAVGLCSGKPVFVPGNSALSD